MNIFRIVSKTFLIIVLTIIFFLFFSLLNIYSFCNNIYWTKEPEETYPTSSDSTNKLNFESESVILIEQNSGNVLFEKNSHEQLRPASVTKVMSLLLIMEALDSGKINLDDKVPCSQNAANMGGSQIWLDTREKLTVNEMIKAICIASANDCTVAMAEFLEGSEETFVAKMNDKAKQLGMYDTTFKNCHGLDTDGHITSSYDIALMSRELLKNHTTITNYTTIYMDTLRDGKSELVNTNKLIKNYKGATGLKTGSTDLALYNLSASATRDNLSLIAVIMKAPTTALRFSEAQKLLDYGFSNYSYISFAKKNDLIKSIAVSKGIVNHVNAVFEDDAGTVLPKGQEKNVEQIIEISDSIEAPVYKNQKVGEIQFVLNNEIIGSTKIVVTDDIKKLELSNMTEKIYYTWFNLLR